MPAEKAHSVSDGHSKQLKGKQKNDFFYKTSFSVLLLQ